MFAREQEERCEARTSHKEALHDVFRQLSFTLPTQQHSNTGGQARPSASKLRDNFMFAREQEERCEARTSHKEALHDVFRQLSFTLPTQQHSNTGGQARPSASKLRDNFMFAREQEERCEARTSHKEALHDVFRQLSFTLPTQQHRWAG
ncbi:hypothetical protein PYW07_014072 [Mythimna separata]|nr:hypothetical protein PYW07_014072 [Mythimna separata]